MVTNSDQMRSQEPVTVVVSQVLMAGTETEFETILTQIIASFGSVDGHLGVEVIRPTDHIHPEYVIIFRFDSYDHLKAWQSSGQHRRWMEQIQPLADSSTREQIVTGLEYWLTPSAASMVPRHKQAFVIWLGIFPLVTILLWLLGPYLNAFPLIVRTFVLTVLLVILMTYAVMPFLMRRLAGWLHAQ